MATHSTAVVIAAHGQRGQLETSDAERLRYVIKGRKLRVVCGDQVRWEPATSGKEVTVTDILPRRNTLERRDQRRGSGEALAANISIVGVVAAALPAPDWFVVDRYLCAAAIMNARCLLVINKADLDTDSIAAEIDNYRQAGYPAIRTTATTGAGIAELQSALTGETGILVGQSGVGKSSLVNALDPAAGVATGELTRASDEGTHTTTASVMHQLPGGGRLIDSPGVRDFVPVFDSGSVVQTGFPEILSLADHCRFSDCRHLQEPGCAVRTAADALQIAPRRYESYRRLLRSISSGWTS